MPVHHPSPNYRAPNTMPRQPTNRVCHFCGAPARKSIDWNGYRPWVCSRHRSRIQRTGSPEVHTQNAVSDDQLRRIVDAVYNRGLSYRKAAQMLQVSSTSVGSGLRRWRIRLGEQSQHDQMSLRELAVYWNLPEETVEEGLRRFDEEYEFLDEE